MANIENAFVAVKKNEANLMTLSSQVTDLRGALIVETATTYEIRYQIDPARFSEVLANVTAQSVALLGFAPENGSGEIGPISVIGIFELEEPVDTHRTLASVSGDEMLVILFKSANGNVVQTNR